ncbi:MAG TPA: CHAT domain-containing protein [Thermoanaerobaculia bacterium]|nr:CHAT domain-containing protein [Thermoanaerobaculia bacterium]
MSAGQGKEPGRYRLRVETLREPAAPDELRSAAVRATWEGFHNPPGEAQIRFLEKARDLWVTVGDDGRLAEVLYLLGNRRSDLLSYEQSAAELQQAAALLERQKGRAGKLLRAAALKHLGRRLKHLDRRQEAKTAQEQALALAREVGDLPLQEENLSDLGLMETEAGELRKGVELQLQALDLARQLRDRQAESIVLNNLAYAHEQLAQPQRALQYYRQALELARGDSDPNGELILLNNIGETYRNLGDWEKAFELYGQAEALSRASSDRVLRAKILINLAFAYRRHLGQMDQARRTLEEALALSRESQSREVQTLTLVNLANLEVELQHPAEAVKYARAAVSLEGSLEEETLSRFALGKALRSQGELGSAQEELGKALALARKRGDGPSETGIILGLAQVEGDRGDFSAALSRIQSSIELIESRRAGVVSPELRTSFLASKQDYYEFQIDTLMSLHAARSTEGYAAKALVASETARARGLLEILNESGADIRLGTNPALVERERAAGEEVNARDWYRRELLAGGNPDREKLAEAEQRLEQALDDLEKVQVELREGNPRYDALIQPQPLGVAEIQSQVLGGRALLLEYALGTKRSFLWAVGPDSMASFELPGREEIEQKARRYYELLTVRNNRLKGEVLPVWKKRIAAADAEAQEVARELSSLILAPAEKLLGDRPLVIVADGALQYIPFAALPIPSTGLPLATRHEVVNLPSASTLGVMRREVQDRVPAPRALALFANPVFEKNDKRLSPGLDKADRLRLSQVPDQHRGDDIDLSSFRSLPFSEKEAETIAALLPRDQVFMAMGFDASRGTVAKGGLDGYRNVHFATHGVIDSRHPELSGLVLSLYNEKGERQDGFLRLNDIYNLRLDADLVVLSACRTALGKEIRGEGLVGLTRGFMYAGASRVLASLWSVEDRATAELMGSLYRGMLREGLSPAAALRKAQLEMAKNPNRKSPYYWAGFSLQGEWQ